MSDSFLEPLPHDFSGDRIETFTLGSSEQGRALQAYKVGDGPLKVSLIAGCHSDEPVGPHTLRQLLRTFALNPNHPWLTLATFFIQPHMNPDGEAINKHWQSQWPNFSLMRQEAFREPPGRDVEFGFPAMRVENKLWSDWIAPFGPMDLHWSLHGMALSEGCLVLIERHWAERAKGLIEKIREKAVELNLGLHDHDRKGDKGFLYYGAGTSSTPEGKAMRAHFLEQKDEAMAKQFHLSSMEFIRSLGGDPLCCVTELPLYAIKGRPLQVEQGQPKQLVALKQQLLGAKTQAAIKTCLSEFEVEPLPLDVASSFQLDQIEWSMRVVQETMS